MTDMEAIQAGEAAQGALNEAARGRELAQRREAIMATLLGACLSDPEFSFRDALTCVSDARDVADAIIEAAR